MNNNNKNIAVCWDLVSYGGVQTCVIVLIKNLNHLGIVPTLICQNEPNKDIITEFDLKINVKIVNYKFAYLKQFLPIYLFDLIYFLDLRKFSFDFFYIFDPSAMVRKSQKFLFYLSMSPKYNNSVFDSKRNKIKMCIYFFTKFFSPKFEFKNKFDRCVINSNFTADIFKLNYGKNIKVIYPPSLFPELGWDLVENKTINKRMLFLSRIEPAKRTHLIFTLAKEFPNFEFVIAGSITDKDYYNDLINIVKSELLENIIFRINLHQEDLIELIDTCTFYFFPAHNEHFGITTLDVMRRGLIPFVHNSGGQKELVPIDILRFDDSNLISKFSVISKLTNFEIQQLKLSLCQNLHEFSNKHYIDNMLSQLNNA